MCRFSLHAVNGFCHKVAELFESRQHGRSLSTFFFSGLVWNIGPVEGWCHMGVFLFGNRCLAGYKRNPRRKPAVWGGALKKIAKNPFVHSSKQTSAEASNQPHFLVGPAVFAGSLGFFFSQANPLELKLAQSSLEHGLYVCKRLTSPGCSCCRGEKVPIRKDTPGLYSHMRSSAISQCRRRQCEPFANLLICTITPHCGNYAWSKLAVPV